MKITSKQKDIMQFSQLMQGDVFEYHGHYLMKIPEVKTSLQGTCNAVRLENGWLVHYAEIDPVRYVDAELVIG